MKRKWFWGGTVVLLFVCLVLTGTLALINRTLPTQSILIDRLGEPEKARLAEFFQVRQQLGDRVWPGWETAVTPVVVYNESYAFLLGYSNPPDGWLKVPQNILRGGPWELVPNDTFNGEAYYRQQLPANGEIPEAFTVKVGEQWATSMPTLEWMQIRLNKQFKTDLPSFLAPIFPYQIASNLFLRGSDGYISLLAHESFHAYQGIHAPARLAAAETAVTHSESIYSWHDPAAVELWQSELDLLAAAVQAITDDEVIAVTQQFLTQRAQRRQDTGLSNDLIDYERQREWLEGLARYVELETWRQASMATRYIPVSALEAEPSFAGYAAYDKRWQQEVAQIGRMADEGDGRFYYSGMAQAVLLDRLMPNWKSQALDDNVFLEDLLATAVGKTPTIK